MVFTLLFILSFIWVMGLLLSFDYIDKCTFLPHPPSKIWGASKINSATALMSLILIMEIICVSVFTWIYFNIGVSHFLSSTWLLKYGTIFVCAYILYYVDNVIRKHYFSFNSLIGWSVLSAMLIGLLFSLCSMPLLIMFACSIGLVLFLFVLTLKDIFTDNDNEKQVFDFTIISLTFAWTAIMGVICYISLSFIKDELDWSIAWKVCVALVVALWWLWVSMDYMANMQKSIATSIIISSRVPLLYGTELMLAFIILIVKYFVPNIKDVFENVSEIDADL